MSGICPSAAKLSSGAKAGTRRAEAAPDRFSAETLGTSGARGRSLNLGQEPNMSPHDRIVAVGLLTRHDLNLLGPTFERAWPIEEAPSFTELLRAIDEADGDLTKMQIAPPGNGRT
jgi:hypothetical protein